jgi:hypothetical protein
MDMSWNATSTTLMNANKLYTFEDSLSARFLQLLKTSQTDGTTGTVGMEPIQVTVQVTNEETETTTSRQKVQAFVNCTYLSQGDFLGLDTILSRVVDPSKFNFSNAKLIFTPNGNTLLNIYQKSGPSGADIGLILATTILCVMLVIVTGILLKVTGGWSACQAKINNCCFEEIEEEVFETKGTFEVQSVCDEAASVDTGVVTTSSGFLGAKQQPQQARNQIMQRDNVGDEENPTAGLGIAPTREYANDDDDDEEDSMLASPVTTHPLGITSVRKLSLESQQQEQGGLANMIMNRMTRRTGRDA